VPIEINGKLIKINTLSMCRENQNTGKKNLVGGNIPDIRSLFIREVPNDPKYTERLEYELALIQEKNLASYLIQAIQILNITKNMPHITRGSCGSSLVCYLLGISHVDPVHYNIKFARFLNEYRNNLPDIDLDFPHHLRKLSNLSRYSFCKAHAFSYAQLIWKLAYMKCHRPFFISQSEIKNCSHYKFALRIYMSPYDFWKATLNNCQSSYKKWVHMYEARIAGVDVYKKNLKKDDVSVYARNRRNKQETIVANQWWLI
jgi:DNA polymerase III alpha subunit